MVQNRKDKILKIVSKNVGITIKELVKELGTSEGPIKKSTDELIKDTRISRVKQGRIYRFYPIDKQSKEEFEKILKKVESDISEIKKKFTSSEPDMVDHFIVTLKNLDQVNVDAQMGRKLLKNELDYIHTTKKYNDLCKNARTRIRSKTKNIELWKFDALLSDSQKFYGTIINTQKFIRSERNNKTSGIRDILNDCIAELDSILSALHGSIDQLLYILEQKKDVKNIGISYEIISSFQYIERQTSGFNGLITHLSKQISEFQQKTEKQESIAHKKIQKSIKKICMRSPIPV